MKNIILTMPLLLFALISFWNPETCPVHYQNVHGPVDSVEIYEWRGFERKGVYADSNLLSAWPEDGPVLAWEYEGIGNGYGSPVFTQDRMYILGEIDSLAFAFCFDYEGNILWKKDFGGEWVKSYPGSRSAPTIAGNYVYVTSGLGTLACLNRLSGDIIWSVNMVHDFGGIVPMHGYSESVITDKEKVFCTPGGIDTNVIALNRFTGDILWISKGKQERSAYNSPQIIRLRERNILVNFSAYHLMGHDTESGELLWTHEQDNTPLEKRKPGMGDTHSNTIIYEDGFIYYAAGDGNGGVKLELSADGKGINEIWRNKDFDSYMGGIIKLGNYLYGCGTAGKDFKTVHAETGQIAGSIKIGSGAVIAADSKLFYYTWAGEVILLSQSPQKPEVISTFKMEKGEKEHFSHPVIHKGKLYVRHGNVIQAFLI